MARDHNFSLATPALARGYLANPPEAAHAALPVATYFQTAGGDRLPTYARPRFTRTRVPNLYPTEAEPPNNPSLVKP